MNAQASHPPVFDPQELERLLIVRQHASDIDGMIALFEPDAVIDCGGGKFLRGHAAIRAFYVEICASGRKFAMGEQRPALICGDLRSPRRACPTATSPARSRGGSRTDRGCG